jgi:hypothetical protein
MLHGGSETPETPLGADVSPESSAPTPETPTETPDHLESEIALANSELARELASHADTMHTLEASFVTDAGTLAHVPNEQVRLNPAIASYFHEMGPDKAYEAYAKLGKSAREQLKQAIATGNFRMVAYIMELPSRGSNILQKVGSDDERLRAEGLYDILHELQRQSDNIAKHKDLTENKP